ncbi:HNH endonuclease [Coraliomargarita parva]|uniref:HNH endonuclease n=1 Tax=Coraliomargarita parva TaxID=3014050 RepID=UPI0022B5DF62|nr:HNH endonuclease [Coraliomargarita parva]
MPLPYTSLNPNRSKAKGCAPHKPLLLLCILDMADSGELDPPLLCKTPGLRLRFDAYWAICQPRWGGLPGLNQPFHYLSSQGFWTTQTKEGAPSRTDRSTHYVEFCPEFIEDLTDTGKRDQIRRILVETWFPEPEQRALYAAFGWSSAKLAQIEWKEAVNEDAEATGRDANFRVRVVTQYQFTCALTGYGLHTQNGHALVEAAHIHQFAKSRNNHPNNGLALTRDAHWMFDKGLWTVSDDLHVLVADSIFKEWGPEVQWLKARHQQPVIFHTNSQLRPAPKHLEWHRTHVFNSMDN